MLGEFFDISDIQGQIFDIRIKISSERGPSKGYSGLCF